MWSFGRVEDAHVPGAPLCRFNALFAGMWSFGFTTEKYTAALADKFQRPFRGHVVFRKHIDVLKRLHEAVFQRPFRGHVVFRPNARRSVSSVSLSRFNALFAGMWSFGTLPFCPFSEGSKRFQRPFRGHVVFRGHRRVRVCPSWLSFNALFAGMWSFGAPWNSSVISWSLASFFATLALCASHAHFSVLEFSSGNENLQRFQTFSVSANRPL